MPTLLIYNTSIIAQTATYTAHQTNGDPTVIACTSVADAATKLQTALTPTVGSGNASTHATAFSTRQNAYNTPSQHNMNFGAGAGAMAVYKP